METFSPKERNSKVVISNFLPGVLGLKHGRLAKCFLRFLTESRIEEGREDFGSL